MSGGRRPGQQAVAAALAPKRSGEPKAARGGRESRAGDDGRGLLDQRRHLVGDDELTIPDSEDEEEQVGALAASGARRQPWERAGQAVAAEETEEEEDAEPSGAGSDAHTDDDDGGGGGGGGGGGVRVHSHAAAAAGPGSGAAAAAAAAGDAASGRRKQAGGKRAAGVAFADAINQLPPDLDEQQLARTRQKLQPRNRMQKAALLDGFRQQFAHWRFLLRQRFSLLFYGFGSKASLLETFAREALTDGGVLVCCGHKPGVNAKQVLQAVAGALTHRAVKSHSHNELLGLICGEPAARQLYVVLHNIDGPGLRSPDEQLWLSRLAQAPAVRLLASADHVNAPLLWSHASAAAFNWLWLEATTYAAYDTEAGHLPPILTGCKQSAAKRGALTVLASLVSTARDVFRLLAEQQLASQDGADAGGAAGAGPGFGISFPALLQLARERFLVNSEHALRSTLTEFRDHELIRLRPGPDGAEVMAVALEPAVLRDALRELDRRDDEEARG